MLYTTTRVSSIFSWSLPPALLRQEDCASLLGRPLYNNQKNNLGSRRCWEKTVNWWPQAPRWRASGRRPTRTRQSHQNGTNHGGYITRATMRFNTPVTSFLGSCRNSLKNMGWQEISQTNPVWEGCSNSTCCFCGHNEPLKATRFYFH